MGRKPNGGSDRRKRGAREAASQGKVSMGGLGWASLDLQNHFPLPPGEREDSLKETWRWEEGQDVCSQTHVLCALPAHV